MSRKLAWIIAGLLFVAFSSAGFAAEKKTSAPKQAQAAQKVTIQGTVVAAEKDAKGNVKRVAIKTEKGEYRVLLKDKGKELLKLIDKKVEATGTVKEAKGKKSILVSEFKEL